MILANKKAKLLWLGIYNTFRELFITKSSLFLYKNHKKAVDKI